MATRSILRPRDQDDIVDAIADAAREGGRLEIRGGGSKADVGAPRDGASLLDMTGFGGIVDYDPAELVLTARAGAPLAELEALIAAEGQMLAFEPFDHGPIFGAPAGAATIGGVVASGVAGSRRLTRGGARDHLLGFKGVSGRGEAFVAGAKVVKNVTGYDLPKLLAGSWGRLAVLTEVTLKVTPRGRAETTLFIEGLSPVEAHRVMARAMGSQAEISAAAHAPGALRGGVGLTALRLEGFGPSVAARCELVHELVSDHRPFAASEKEAGDFWGNLRTLASLADGRPLWRVNVPPGGGCVIVAATEPHGARWLFDWAGGLVWLTFDGEPRMVRDTAAAAGGHASLVRGPETLRASTSAFHPPAPGVGALEARVRRAFDPASVFETGRFLDEAHAN
jgi:glycolate oxidase FAD binding subunit